MNRASSATPSAPPAAVGAVGATGLAAAAITLGYALQIYRAAVAYRPIIALTGAILLAAQSVLLPRGRLQRGREERLLVVAGIIAIAYGAYTFLVTRGDVHVADGLARRLFSLAVAAAAVLAATALRRRPPLGRAHVPLLLVVCLVLGISVVRSRPIPAIDVYLFHDEALKALLAGTSPYSITIPNIYGSAQERFYSAGLVVHDRVQVGHPYPPLSLLLALPGYLAGDYRYALVAAIVGAAALLAYVQPAPRARVAAALLLFTPRIFFLEVQGWSDAFIVLALAGVTLCAVRARRALPFALGAFIATKQYSLLAVPAVVLLFPPPLPWRQVGRMVAVAALVAAALTLPFVAWDPHGFVRSVMLFQASQPFRADSLSFLAVFPAGRRILSDSAPGVIAAVVALALSLWRAPRTPAGFAGAVALTGLAFFAFAKQAFWNYYLFVLGAMACAVAASGAPGDSMAPERDCRAPRRGLGTP